MVTPSRREILRSIGEISTIIGIGAMSTQTASARSKATSPHTLEGATVPDLQIINNGGTQQVIAFSARHNSSSDSTQRSPAIKEVDTEYTVGAGLSERVSVDGSIDQTLQEINANRGNWPSDTGPSNVVVEETLEFGGGEYAFTAVSGTNRDSIMLKIGDEGFPEWKGLVVMRDESNVKIGLEVV